MNNSQFRRLVLDTPTGTAVGSGHTNKSANKKDGAFAASLGSRMSSSIPMTPRSVVNSAGIDFARQVQEQNAALNPSATRKFRSTAIPKGTKLGSGYQDRTRLRISNEEDEKAVRVKALEEMVKLGQMDKTTFEALRDEIIGGDVKDVHLVKGLDWKLLERVKRGEDVLAAATASTQMDRDIQPRKDDKKDDTEGDAPSIDIDEEFNLIEGNEIQPVLKLAKSKKGEMAPPPLQVRKKRTRDEILKELKASRLVAAETDKQAKHPSLGPRFTKLGDKKQESRIKTDSKGREVLITVDEEGRVKKKVKRARVEDDHTSDRGLLMPNKDVKPLGMEVTPIISSAPADESDGDIFEGIGNDYNPLAGLEEDESDESDGSDPDSHIGRSDGASLRSPISGSQVEEKSLPHQEPPDEHQTPLDPENPPLDAPKPKRNYFNDSEAQPEDFHPTPTSNSLKDPTILAALKKASTIHPLTSDTAAATAEEAAKAARRKKMLETHDRDEDDMDLGFGGSRLEDGEDGDDAKIKLSVWKGEGAGEAGGGGKGKRKRGAKKRKGDANSAADVLRVMAARRGER